jgi:hypothetical protein
MLSFWRGLRREGTMRTGGYGFWAALLGIVLAGIPGQARAADDVDAFKFKACDKSDWTAGRIGDHFVHARDNGSNRHNEDYIGYLNWAGTKCRYAKVKPGLGPGGDPHGYYFVFSDTVEGLATSKITDWRIEHQDHQGNPKYTRWCHPKWQTIDRDGNWPGPCPTP